MACPIRRVARAAKEWQERKEVEGRRQPGGFIEPRLIYYADFYDIQTILEKHWGKFSEALGDWKTIRVYLILIRFQDRAEQW